MIDPPTIRCWCRRTVWLATFDDGVDLRVEIEPDPSGNVVIREDGRFHLMRGRNYPAEAERHRLHTCTGGR